MPELYSDHFLATVTREVAATAFEQTEEAALSPPLKQQFRAAFSNEAHKLAALVTLFEKLKVEQPDRSTSSLAVSGTLDRYLLDPHKKNLAIAIFYGVLGGNNVFVFLHVDSGTFPFKLTYHSFHPKTNAHVSEHMGRYVWDNMKKEQRAEAFVPVTNELQLEALTLYFFSCFETLPNAHPDLVRLVPALSSVCDSVMDPEYISKDPRVRAFRQAWNRHKVFLGSHQAEINTIEAMEAELLRLKNIVFPSAVMNAHHRSQEEAHALKNRRSDARNQMRILKKKILPLEQRAAGLVRKFNVAHQEMNEAWDKLTPAEKNAVHLQYPRLERDVDVVAFGTEWECVYSKGGEYELVY
ncbi:hypothetical protein PMIN06_006294 [Paraphaeosphaeria minitans]